jgi:glycosyltransferase involved in cell wall biosynthesis
VIDALKVAAVARRLRPEIIHLHCTNPIAFLYVLLFRLLRIPLAATAHVVTPHEPMRFQGFVYGSSYRLCQLLITHSEVDRRRLIDELGVNPDHLAVIPHGEYGFFERCGELPERHTARIHLGLASDAEVALFFGYIREYKGLDVLLDAWSAVLEARPRARLVIAGDPVRLDPARHGELQSRADDLGALHRFDYVPFSEVPTYFAAADTLVMPYRSISQSGVLYLALSLGVPVVATRVGALPEILRHGESALLVPPEHPDALAEALIRVLSGAALRQRLAVGGSEIARQHSWPAIAKHTETVFRRLIMD